MLAFLTRQLPAFLFPFFHEDFSHLLLGLAEGLASGGKLLRAGIRFFLGEGLKIP